MENLKNSSYAFWFKYGESISLMEKIGDKLFLAMSNLYFFNLSKWIQVDFIESFPDGQILNFANVFPIKAASTKSRVFLA